ncbi:MAG: hypothetical protein HYW02_03775 [Deltaproteobacteria bacterium]|nr:hypothetical protein [Deltaproteobacteria bacterium]MBI2500585.1 hypothetical protein [Deltaproteobacteria bacterium]
MNRKFAFLVTVVVFSLAARITEARQGFSIGLGPIGNIFLVDTIPVLDPGIGGHMFFQYRFHEQVAFQTSFLMTTQDGDEDPNSAGKNDTGILFLGMPVMDIKFYLLQGEPRFDPYLGTGLGIYWLTEGRFQANNTGGVGLGTQIDVGFDYYLTEIISFGFEGVFRSVALITDLGTPSASGAEFPYSLTGNVAFHF